MGSLDYLAAVEAALLEGLSSQEIADIAEAAGAPPDVVAAMRAGTIPDVTNIPEPGQPPPPPPPTPQPTFPPQIPDEPGDPPDHPEQDILLPIEDGVDLDGLQLLSVGSYSGQAFVDRCRNHAARHDVDALAAACVANYEGLNGGMGDGGTAFGPWQIHLTDGRLRKFVGRPAYDAQLNRWAWDDDGVDYAMRSMVAGGAKGLSGSDAISRIVYGFEKPKDKAGEYNRATDAYDALRPYGDRAWEVIAHNAHGPKGSVSTPPPPPVTSHVPTSVGGAFDALTKSLAHTAPDAGHYASNVGGKLMRIFQ